jgi:hypothetical protein
MGAAFVVALRGHQVIEAHTSARLRVYRTGPDPNVVLGWEMCCAHKRPQ